MLFRSFGSEDSYVIPVQSLEHTTDLREAFQTLFVREDELRGHLQAMMPSYIAQTDAAREMIRRIMKA